MKTGFVINRSRSGRLRSEENVTVAREAFDLSQGKSISRASLESNISPTSIQRIFTRELIFFPYKIQVVRKLESQDHDKYEIV